jgi:hypothetical protein
MLRLLGRHHGEKRAALGAELGRRGTIVFRSKTPAAPGSAEWSILKSHARATTSQVRKICVAVAFYGDKVAVGAMCVPKLRVQ